MSKLLIGTVLLAGATTMAACRGDDRHAAYENTIGDQSGSARTNATDATNASQNRNDTADFQFVQEMMTGGQKEVELGQLAQSKASSAAVKEFGQMMVRDHSQAASELKQAASQQNINAGPETDKVQSAKDQFADKTGAEFDRAYMDAMVDDHQHDVSMLQEKTNGTAGEPIKAWASKTLPVVQQHLSRAQEIQRSLKK